MASAKALLLRIATQMNKSEADFQKFLQALDDNMIDTVEAMRDVTDDQWKNDLKFPVGLINKIKKELEQPQNDVEMIDTSSKKPSHTLPFKEMQWQISQVRDKCSDLLAQLVSEINDQQALFQTLTLLYKIVSNILQNALDPKFRRIPRSSKSLQEKVLRYQNATMFLLIAGFKDTEEAFELEKLELERLQEASKSLEEFIQSNGG